MRGRLQQMPPLLTNGLWDAQIEAITNLERSLAEDRPRALIQMATGSGRHFGRRSGKESADLSNSGRRESRLALRCKPKCLKVSPA